MPFVCNCPWQFSVTSFPTVIVVELLEAEGNLDALYGLLKLSWLGLEGVQVLCDPSTAEWRACCSLPDKAMVICILSEWGSDAVDGMAGTGKNRDAAAVLLGPRRDPEW